MYIYRYVCVYIYTCVRSHANSLQRCFTFTCASVKTQERLISDSSGLATEFVDWCMTHHCWDKQAAEDLVMARTLVDADLLPLLAKWFRRDLVSQLDTALHKHYPPEERCILWSSGCVSGKPPLHFLFGWRADGSGELRGHWRPLLDALPSDSDLSSSVPQMKPFISNGHASSWWPKDTHAAQPAGEPAATSDSAAAPAVPASDALIAGADTAKAAAIAANKAAALIRRSVRNKLGDLRGHPMRQMGTTSMSMKPCSIAMPAFS